MNCPLCKLEKLTDWLYEDGKIVICRCLSHPDKWLCILRRHTAKPTLDELQYLSVKMQDLLGAKNWRGPNSILEHFHLHEI